MHEHPPATTAIVITTYNHARYLAEALDSCVQQTLCPDEIIVVDDGSTDDPASVVGRYKDVRLIRQENRGLAAARNSGLAATNAMYVTFLDADDRLLPEALEIGLAKLRGDSEAALVYGAHRLIGANGEPASGKFYTPVSDDPYIQLIRAGNFIAMHAAVLFDREKLASAGGYNEDFRSCEDYELLLRIARFHRVISHDRIVAEYRMHGDNMSKNSAFMLKTSIRALDLQPSASGRRVELQDAIRDGKQFWKTYYAGQMYIQAVSEIRKAPRSVGTYSKLMRAFFTAPAVFLKSVKKGIAKRTAKRVPASIGRMLSGPAWVPPLGKVRFGDFARVNPISDCFGFDRGQPIDRYYIEKFLARNAQYIRGRVLEIGDNSYTRMFGDSQVSQSDVLHVDLNHPTATFRGDLTDPQVLPANAFDCIVFTQTLHLIFDMPKAVAALERVLKPGGVLLLTVPGITPVDRGEWGDTWYWSLTKPALAQLLSGPFDAKDIATEHRGNVLAAVSFLQGLAASEVPADKLDVVDPAFPVLVAARATKRQAR